MKVLVIVDVQNGFCPGGELAVPEGDKVVPVINNLMRSGEYDHVIATKDFHPANHVSFARNHPDRQPFEVIDLDGVKQTLWPAHCEQHTHSSDFHPQLDARLIEKVIHKGTNPKVDSYSAFFDNAGNASTGLVEYLEDLAAKNGIEVHQIELTFCGLATDYCVLFSARDAKRLGFDVKVIVDACRAVNLNPGASGELSDEVKALREMAAMDIELIESREISPSRERMQVRADRGMSH